MTDLQQALLGKLQALPPDKQQEVLDFAEFLYQKTATRPPLHSLKGLWADIDIDITQKDIAQARTEMWSDFPRGEI